MDLRAYYQKVRETEAALPSPHVVLMSLATPDGGKFGVVTEAPTPIAARMLVEGSARPATSEEANNFRERQTTAKQVAEDAAVAGKVQIVVVPAAALATPPVHSGKEQ